MVEELEHAAFAALSVAEGRKGTPHAGHTCRHLPGLQCAFEPESFLEIVFHCSVGC